MAHRPLCRIFQVNRILFNMQERIFKPRVKFSPADDRKLRSLVDAVDTVDWNAVAGEMEGKNPRQCHERWINYLAPNLNTEPWTADEDLLLMHKYRELGSRWVQMACFFPNRTGCMVKNRLNRLRRRERKHLAIARPPAKFTCQAFTNTRQSRLLPFANTQFTPVPHKTNQPTPQPPQQPHVPSSQVPNNQMYVFDTHDFGPDIWSPEGFLEIFDIW
jgi:hypothetical protein